MLADEQYEREGLKAGKTVAEWERARGLPPFSIYPEARHAARHSAKGFFMYRNATDEEREQMKTACGGARWRK